MNFEKGNELWRVRRPQRGAVFKTPDALWQAACDYFNWCLAHPVLTPVCRGRKNTGLMERRPRAFTTQGLCVFLGCSVQELDRFEAALNHFDDPKAEAFEEVITQIRDIIYWQKFIGAEVGVFNARLIGWELGRGVKG